MFVGSVVLIITNVSGIKLKVTGPSHSMSKIKDSCRFHRGFHLSVLYTDFRITGKAGSRIRDTCPPSFSCGSHGGLWTDAEMPSSVGETSQVPIYGALDGKCDW